MGSEGQYIPKKTKLKLLQTIRKAVSAKLPQRWRRWPRWANRSRSKETKKIKKECWRSPTHNSWRRGRSNPIRKIKESTRSRWHLKHSVEVVLEQSNGVPYEYQSCDAKIEIFPEEMEVIVIPKNGKDKFFPQNYRPISLLTTRRKMAERIVEKMLKEHTEDLGILLNVQFTPTRNVKRIWIRDVFLDVFKVFDRVWH